MVSDAGAGPVVEGGNDGGDLGSPVEVDGSFGINAGALQLTTAQAPSSNGSMWTSSKRCSKSNCKS